MSARDREKGEREGGQWRISRVRERENFKICKVKKLKVKFKNKKKGYYMSFQAKIQVEIGSIFYVLCGNYQFFTLKANKYYFKI